MCPSLLFFRQCMDLINYSGENRSSWRKDVKSSRSRFRWNNLSFDYFLLTIIIYEMIPNILEVIPNIFIGSVYMHGILLVYHLHQEVSSLSNVDKLLIFSEIPLSC